MKWPSNIEPPHSIIKAMGWTIEEFSEADLNLIQSIPEPDLDRITKALVNLLAVPGSYFIANNSETMGVTYNEYDKSNIIFIKKGPLLDNIIKITSDSEAARAAGVRSITIPITNEPDPTTTIH